MAHFVLSPNGEESLNRFSSPDPNPDRVHLRGGNNTSYVKNKSIGAIIFELRTRTDKQTDRHKLTQMHNTRAPLWERR